MNKKLNIGFALLLTSFFAMCGASEHNETAKALQALEIERDTPVFNTNFDSKAEVLKRGDELSRQLVQEGTVLLKNEDNCLPLKRGAKISLFGKRSFYTAYNGNGSGSGYVKGPALRLDKAFEEGGFSVNPSLLSFYSNGSINGGAPGKLPAYQLKPGYLVNEGNIANLKSHVDESTYEEYGDAAIVFVGRNGGEATDLPKLMATNWDASHPMGGTTNPRDHSLQLNKDETDLLKYCGDHFKNVIVVVNSANNMEMGFLDDPGHYSYHPNIKGALWLGLPGRGNSIKGLIDVLSGAVTPSGHLADTYIRDFKLDPSFENSPSYNINLLKYDNFDKGHTNYKEGIYTGYRYYETRGFTEGNEAYDSKDELHGTTTKEWDSWYNAHVVYPFGHGLSYTTFEWEQVEENSDAVREMTKDSDLSLSVKVTNTGKVPGKEVVQLYVSSPYYDNQIEKPYVQLVEFGKTRTLRPGESEIITLKPRLKDFASYDYNDANHDGYKGYELDAGDYIFRFGKTAHDPVFNYTYNLKETIKLEKSASGTEIKPQFEEAAYDNTTYLSRMDFEGTFPHCPTKEERTLPEKYLDSYNKTTFNNKIVADDINNPWYTEEMPAFGNNTFDIKLPELYGLPFDDPKWEEFLSQFKLGNVEERNTIASVVFNCFYGTEGISNSGLPWSIQCDGPSGLQPRVGGGVANTNFCVDMTVACTYNRELAFQKGLIAGNEAVFGDERGTAISGVYGPGLNIHRNNFLGRNFEYWSEDPLLTGVMGGHCIKGYNSKGVITFMKHFALNEQEYLRENVFTWANEQTIREIYLRPFQMAVEDYHSHGVMTSLNNLGAVWTGGHYNLLTNVLRNEWGFDGIVLTDYCSGRPQLNANMALRAGFSEILTKHNSRQKMAEITPTTAAVFKETFHYTCYNYLNYSNILTRKPTNFIGKFENKTLEPAIAGIEYHSNVTALGLGVGVKAEDVTYSLKTDSALPEGMSINERGEISGIASEDYGNKEFTVIAKCEYSIKEATFNIPVINKDESILYLNSDDHKINNAEIGRAYHQDISWATLANGQEIDITYTLTNDSMLPDGLELTKDGIIQGTPTKGCRDYKISVTASAEGKHSMTLDIYLNIGNFINFNNKDLASGRANVRYSECIANGKPGVTYALKDGSKLPLGLTLTKDGYIVGTPTECVKDFTFTVISSGKDYIEEEATFSINIGLNFASFSVDHLKVGNESEVYLNFAQGQNDIKYRVVDGNLPSGLTLSEEGILSGTPKEAGNFVFTVEAIGEGVDGATTQVSIYVAPTATNNNYYIGLGLGIGTVVLALVGAIIFFCVFDKKNRIEGVKNKTSKKILISCSAGIIAIGTIIGLSFGLLSPVNASGMQNTFVFEAEYVDLSNFHGAGISNSADGVNNIIGDGSQDNIDKGYSNGYFLSNTYAENTIEWVINSDSNVDGKLILRLSSELGNITVTENEMKITVNDEPISYKVAIPNSKSGEHNFADYPIDNKISLVEGENSIKFTILQNTLNSGSIGGPLIDCIKINTSGELDWEPLTDNVDNRGSI